MASCQNPPPLTSLLRILCGRPPSPVPCHSSAPRALPTHRPPRCVGHRGGGTGQAVVHRRVCGPVRPVLHPGAARVRGGGALHPAATDEPTVWGVAAHGVADSRMMPRFMCPAPGVASCRPWCWPVCLGDVPDPVPRECAQRPRDFPCNGPGLCGLCRPTCPALTPPMLLTPFPPPLFGARYSPKGTPNENQGTTVRQHAKPIADRIAPSPPPLPRLRRPQRHGND